MSTEWKMVPVEPTAAMIDAHFEAHAKARAVFADVPDVWRAMLSAAPEAPGEPVAWQWEAFEGGCWETRHSRRKPDLETWLCETRNLRPLCTHPAPQAAVRVKPLEWVDRHSKPTRANDLIARTMVGTYAIRPSADGLRFRLFVPGGVYHEAPEFTDVGTAKAAAQADYENRILSSLEPSPSTRGEAPARTYEDGVRAALKAVDDCDIQLPVAPGFPDGASMARRQISAAILPLIQGGK